MIIEGIKFSVAFTMKGVYKSWIHIYGSRRKVLVASSMRYVLCVLSSDLFWMSSSLDIPAGVTQKEGHTGFFIHLPSAVHASIFSREIFSRSFPSSTVKSNFLY